MAAKAAGERPGASESDRQRSKRNASVVFSSKTVRARRKDRVAAVGDRVLREVALPELHQAVRDGRIEDVTALLAGGADANIQDGEYGYAPGGLRSFWRHVTPQPEANLLAPKSDCGAPRWTPLHIAAFKGDPSVVAALLAGSADLSIKDKRGYRCALHHVVCA